jgi:MFS family permease
MRPRLLTSFYVYQATASFVFFQPIFFVFYETHLGIPKATILWLLSYNVATRALLELPFGALADRWSRRGCLAASALCIAAGALALLVAPAFATVILAETAFATAHALRSGADSAYLYDALADTDDLLHYPQAEGRGRALSALGAGLTAVVGGMLAWGDLRWPYVATVVAALAGALVAARLHEPVRNEARLAVERGLMREAARMAVRSVAIRWNVALAVFAVVVSHLYFFLQQPYLESVGVPLWMFGVVFASTKVVTAAVASGAHHVEARLDRRGTAALMAVVPTVGIGGMALITNPFGAALIFTRGILDGLWEPLVNVYMNHLAPTRLRATLLSLQSLAARLGLSLALFVLGVSVDAWGLRATLAAAALATALAGVVLVITAPRPRGPVPRPCRPRAV